MHMPLTLTKLDGHVERHEVLYKTYPVLQLLQFELNASVHVAHFALHAEQMMFSWFD